MISIFEKYAELHTLIFDVDRIPHAIAAIMLTAVVGMVTGPIRGNANPFLWGMMDGLFGKVGDKLDKKERAGADLVFRGFMIMTLAVLLAAILAEIGKFAIQNFNTYGTGEAVMVALGMSTGAVFFALLRLYFALGKGQMQKGTYFAIARTSRVDLNTTDEFGMTRLGMGMAARSFDKAVVAPVIWYLIGGLTALYVYAAIAALAWRFGKNGFTKGFGAAPLALEKLLGVVPSLFSAVLMTAASAFTPTAGIMRSIQSWFGKKGSAPYTQGGYPVSAMAWALAVSLGGPAKDLNGSAMQMGWVGPEKATAKVEPHHMKRALYINLMAHLLFVAVLLVAYSWGSFFPVG